MRQDERTPFMRALHRARVSAYPSGEFVGQESFMTAGEIREIAQRAGIGRGTAVLDLCCGVAGPGRLIAQEFACDYLGVDASADAIAIARECAADLPCRFVAAEVPPLPDGRFEVVVLLETMLAFPDKPSLFDAVAHALPEDGRFAFTLEEGEPLEEDERMAMPDSDTVWLSPLDEIDDQLRSAGLLPVWQRDLSGAHRESARSLTAAFRRDADHIAAGIGRRALDELVAAHDLWVEWLSEARVRKFAIVAKRR